MGTVIVLVVLVAVSTTAGCSGAGTGTPEPGTTHAETTDGERGRPATDATLAGTWRALPPAPRGIAASTASWTGTSMVVFSRVGDPASPKDQARCLNVAASYVPATRTWRRLAPPVGPAGRQETRQCFQGTDSSV